MIDLLLLRQFVPIDMLCAEHLAQIAGKCRLEQISAGETIFELGDEDCQSVYLLAGEVSLLRGDRAFRTISGGSDAARHPLAQFQPRQLTAVARSDVTLVRIESRLIDSALTWGEVGGYVVKDLGEKGCIDDTDDWMMRMLHRDIFLRIPPANIQTMFMRMEPVSFPAGAAVILQGDEGDYYYVIVRGRCQVTRHGVAGADEVVLADLGPGESFGEEALVSDARRNATVTMLTDGELMRLAKEEFNNLLNEPVLNWVAIDDARILQKRGAVWIDLRTPSEFGQGHIEGSINLPYHTLRRAAQALDHSMQYIAVCDSGARSSAAAFLLCERGFNVSVLKGGLARLVPSEINPG